MLSGLVLVRPCDGSRGMAAEALAGAPTMPVQALPSGPSLLSLSPSDSSLWQLSLFETRPTMPVGARLNDVFI